LPNPEETSGTDGNPGPPAAPRNPLEARLVAIWSGALGIDHMGIHDNFFDRGGHSLLAISLLWSIERELGRGVSIATLFECPTIAELARYLRGHPPRSARPVVERLRDGAREPAIVLLPSAFGSPDWGRPLSRWLPPHLPVYGIRLAGDSPYWDGCETMADIAAGFMEALVDAVPNGPYVLVGYSFGGRAAFELARQMRANGLDISLVVILDTGIQPPGRSPWVRLSRDLPSILANLPRKLALDILPSPRTMAHRLRIKLRAWSAPLLGRLSALGLTVPSLAEQMFDTRRFPELYKERLEISLRAFRGYQPGIYRGRVAVIKCRVRPLIHRSEPDLGWGRWVDGPVEVRTVPGHHTNFLREPRVYRVAGILAALLQGGHEAPCPDAPTPESHPAIVGPHQARSTESASADGPIRQMGRLLAQVATGAVARSRRPLVEAEPEGRARPSAAR
jgi:thioesterase domain-containing protein